MIILFPKDVIVSFGAASPESRCDEFIGTNKNRLVPLERGIEFSIAAPFSLGMSPSAASPSSVLGPLVSLTNSCGMHVDEMEEDDWRLLTPRDCRFCTASSIRTDWAQGDRVCTSCGVVQEEHIIDRGPEWRDYGDNDDHPTAFVARCSLQPNQDHSTTTWSRSVFLSGVNGARSNHPVAQRLRKIHLTIERRMEMQQKNTLSAAALKIKLARKQLQRNPLRSNSVVKLEVTRMTTDVDTENTDTVTTTMNEEEEDVPDYGSSVEWIEEERPVSEFEQVLLQEERRVAQQRQALYARKWSLDRAKRLFGIDASNTEMEDEDAVLQQAARDVYTCYELLCQAGPTLQLPVTLIEEAAGWLCQYAARRDGFKVKGIASSTASGARSSKEEKSTLREAHKLRQMAALCAASVFWIARERQRPRTLVAICQSIRIGNGATVARKHCSRALQELKRCFPSFAPVPAAISCIQNGVAAMQQEPKDTTWSRRVESIRSRVEHLLHPLQLPPVAEAAIRYLVVVQCCEGPPESTLADARKLATRCAALTYLVCSAGRTLQRLAQQTQAQPSAPRLWSGRAASSERDATSIDSLRVTDAMDEEENEDVAEQRAYEMRRMWDAWSEQLPWERSGRLLESARAALLDEYQQRVFPQRVLLLQTLRDVVQDRASCTTEEEEVASVLELERVLLEKTPLAPVLLSHIAMAAPLMKMDLQL
jgi:TFIIB zinc-binding